MCDRRSGPKDVEMMILKIVIGLLLVLILSIFLLRMRKLRIDKMRLSSQPLDPRLVTPPPSPYQRAAGFRILDGAEDIERREPARPRLDHDRDYVFSDSYSGEPDDYVASPRRHDEEWALERSAHGGSSLISPAVIGGVVATAVVVVGLIYVAFSKHWF